MIKIYLASSSSLWRVRSEENITYFINHFFLFSQRKTEYCLKANAEYAENKFVEAEANYKFRFKISK
jgi:hypothetical protein